MLSHTSHHNMKSRCWGSVPDYLSRPANSMGKVEANQRKTVGNHRLLCLLLLIESANLKAELTLSSNWNFARICPNHLPLESWLSLQSSGMKLNREKNSITFNQFNLKWKRSWYELIWLPCCTEMQRRIVHNIRHKIYPKTITYVFLHPLQPRVTQLSVILTSSDSRPKSVQQVWTYDAKQDGIPGAITCTHPTHPHAPILLSLID